MKITLCALICIATLCLADFKPTWINESDPVDPWQPTSVIFDKEPKPGKHIVINICGQIIDVNLIKQFVIEAHVGLIVVFSTTKDIDAKKPKPGDDFCFKYEADLPYIYEDLMFTVELTDKDSVHLGAVSFELISSW